MDEEWRSYLTAVLRATGPGHPGLTDADLAEESWAGEEFCVRVRGLRAAVVADARSRRFTFDNAPSVPPLLAALVTVWMCDEFELITLYHASAELKADRGALVAEAARRCAFSLWEIASGRDPPIFHPSGVLPPRAAGGGGRGRGRAPPPRRRRRRRLAGRVRDG